MSLQELFLLIEGDHKWRPLHLHHDLLHFRHLILLYRLRHPPLRLHLHIHLLSHAELLVVPVQFGN